jgi:hypothetical protein
MDLNNKIQAYLSQNNIDNNPGDYETGQPAGQADQVLVWNTDRLGTQPTQEQLDAAWAAKTAADNATAYRAKRAAEYPSIGDQLDALYHAGLFPAEMAATIEAVKLKYPK